MIDVGCVGGSPVFCREGDYERSSSATWFDDGGGACAGGLRSKKAYDGVGETIRVCYGGGLRVFRLLGACNRNPNACWSFSQNRSICYGDVADQCCATE